MKRMLTTVVAMGTMAAMTCGLIAAEPTFQRVPDLVPQAPAGRLTLEQVGKMLENLGYNPKPYTNKDGKVVGYNLEFESSTWTIRFSVYLSNDQSQVWFDAGLGRTNDLASLTPQGLLALLEQNDMIRPAYIFHLKAQQRLMVSLAFDNAGLNPGKMRSKVESFAEIVKKVITEYQKAAKPVQQAPAAPAPIPGL